MNILFEKYYFMLMIGLDSMGLPPRLFFNPKVCFSIICNVFQLHMLEKRTLWDNSGESNFIILNLIFIKLNFLVTYW